MKINLLGIECEAQPARNYGPQSSDGWVAIVHQQMVIGIGETLADAVKEAKQALIRAGAYPNQNN